MERSSPTFIQMRQGQFELLLVTEDGLTMEEQVIDGRSTARAEPGSSFHVRANVFKDGNGNFPSDKFLRYSLYVDGAYIHYDHEVLLQADACEPVSSDIWGFLKNDTDVLSFKFASTRVSAEPTAASAEQGQALGSIKLVVYSLEYEDNCALLPLALEYKETPSEQSILESKKFWQQPSVTTVAGRLLPGKIRFLSATRKMKSRTLLTTLELHYHTGDMVELLDRIHSGALQQATLVSGRTSALAAPQVVDLTDENDIGSMEASALTPLFLDLTREPLSSPPLRRASELLVLTDNDATNTGSPSQRSSSTNRIKRVRV